MIRFFDASALVKRYVEEPGSDRVAGLLQRHPLRAGDALQLAALLEIREELGEDVELVCYDDRLTAAAETGVTPSDFA
jgi:hypothetical protein